MQPGDLVFVSGVYNKERGTLLHTLKPPNKGHFGSTTLIFYREVILFQRLFYIVQTIFVPSYLSSIKRLSSPQRVH